jgi:hypothetical protein
VGRNTSSLCYYCQGRSPLPSLRSCSECGEQLLKNREAFLQRLIADAQEDLYNFEILSKGAAPYRISKGSPGADEYATKRFGELVGTMKQRIAALTMELEGGKT